MVVLSTCFPGVYNSYQSKTKKELQKAGNLTNSGNHRQQDVENFCKKEPPLVASGGCWLHEQMKNKNKARKKNKTTFQRERKTCQVLILLPELGYDVPVQPFRCCTIESREKKM